MSRGSSRGRRNASRGLGVAVFAIALALAAGARSEGADGARSVPELVPAQGKLLGFSGIRPRGDLAPGLTSRLVAGINGNATRTVLHWQALEPRRDRYDAAAFRDYATLYRALRRRGITPILVLQYAPAWARDVGLARLCGSSDSCHYPPSASMLGEWQEFVRTVVRRFPDAAIEVWNEPNYKGQWQSGVDPARYVRLLAATRSAAASVDPRTTVFAGGLGTTVKDESLTPAVFLRQAYESSPSLRGNADALNLHLFPGHFLGPGSTFARAFAAVRAARDEAGDASTPILVSEIGRTTTGPMAIGEVEQAKLLVRAARKVLAMRDTLGVLLYTLADRDELPADEHERGFGVVQPLGGPESRRVEPKAAYCALRKAARDPYAGCPEGGRPRPRLRARARPRRAAARPGGRAKRLAIRVRAPRAERRVEAVRVCIRRGERGLRVRSRRCRLAGSLRPGESVRTAFRVGLRRRAGSGPRRLTFVASGKRARRGRTHADLVPRVP